MKTKNTYIFTLVFTIGLIVAAPLHALAKVARNCVEAGLTERDINACRSYRKMYGLNADQIQTCTNPIFSEEDRIDCMYSVSKRKMTVEQMAQCKPEHDYDISSEFYCLVHTD